MRRAVLPLAFLAACRCDAPPRVIDAGLPPCAELGGVRAGEATFYDPGQRGKCSFQQAPDELVAAMNRTDYGDAVACGACAEVEGPRGAVVVRVVDRCSGCGDGNLDLARAAFARIADLDAGRVPIRWRWVPCPVDGPLRYRFKDGSNPDWTALQVRNHRHAIARLDARLADGTWRTMARADYNYFVSAAGLGPGPYTFRITDVHGLVVQDVGIAAGDAVERAGLAQLPPCAAAPR